MVLVSQRDCCERGKAWAPTLFDLVICSISRTPKQRAFWWTGLKPLKSLDWRHEYAFGFATISLDFVAPDFDFIALGLEFGSPGLENLPPVGEGGELRPGAHRKRITGWGGRIRTSAWRNQNPLPYRLATPQCAANITEFLMIYRHRGRLVRPFSLSRLSAHDCPCFPGVSHDIVFLDATKSQQRASFMAEPIPLFELEMQIALLPRVSRRAHLAGPAIHAQRLVELWKVDDDVPLSQAFRLLPEEEVERAIARTALMSNHDYPNDRVHWPLPPLHDLLPGLHDAAWQALLDGELQIEATRYERGKVGLAARPVPLVELPRLSPGFELSRLCRGDRDEWLDARVRRAPVELPKHEPTKPTKKSDLKIAMEEVAAAYPPGAHPPEAKIWGRLKILLPGVSRAEARLALKNWAPHLRLERGRPRKPPA
jgi:hypothetical protein